MNLQKFKSLKVGQKVYTNKDSILTNDRKIPKGTVGLVTAIEPLPSGQHIVWVKFRYYKNPVTGDKDIGFHYSELE